MQFAAILEQLRAAGEESRLRIIALLNESDLTVTELVRCLDQLQPRVSRHLKILVEAGLVAPYQEGAWRFYRLAALPDWLAAMVEALEGDEIEHDRRALQAIRSERAEKAAAYFAENADAWDAVRQLHIDDAEIERALLDLAPEHVDAFLDLGTGTGRMLTVFSDRYASGAGYDMSPEMLAVARVRIQDAGLRHVHLRRRDILKPDEIPALSADLICIHHVLHFLAEPERAIAAAASALRPGGALLIADFQAHVREELRTEYAHRRLGFHTDELSRLAISHGLLPRAERSLPPEREGGLVSMIWRFDKPNTPQPIQKSDFLHA
ncbi:MAG: metalloregulator ArsR/SmtB family transcription factor [Pseudomonadota bacterium]